MSTATGRTAFFLTPFLRGHNSGGEGTASATRLGYRQQTRPLASWAHDEPHPTVMRTLAAPLRRTGRLCQGLCPGRSRYSFVPGAVAIRRSAGSPPGGGSSSARLTAGAGRQAFPPSPGRCGGGRVDRGMVLRHQARLPWDSVTLIPFVPRPTDGSRPAFTTTAVEIFGCGRCPIKRSGYLDRP